ncbi:MAG: adenosylcobinamide-phosphate synthase CbiB [Acidimicrobiia bacterium]
MRSGLAITAGWAADQLLGEPPTRYHPVAWFGKTMQRLEKTTYRDARTAGAIHTAVGVAIGVGVGRVATKILGRLVATAAAVAICVAGRMLADEASKIIDAVEDGDLDTARQRLPTLVGRETADLTEPEILRAVIESVAENTNDAVIASIFWATIGGAPAVLAHRAINTLDAMIGHRNQRYDNFGWAAARLDDLANYLPARIGALGIALLAPHRAHEIHRAVREDAPKHPSPNGGVIEAAVAAALDIELGGINRYDDRIEDRGTLGGTRIPTTTDAREAIKLTNRLGVLAATIASAKW